MYIYIFIPLVVCLTTGPKPLPKRALHIVRFTASFFKWEYPLLSLRLSSSLLRLLPRLPVTFVLPFMFPSITRCRRQFLRRMWPVSCYGQPVRYIRLVVCLTTGPKPLRKRALHIVRSTASSFKWEYPFFSLRSSSSSLHLLPRLPVTYILPFIFPSITRCRRQFLRRMWPIQLAFRLLISCRMFLCSLTVSNTSSFLTYLSRSNWNFPSFSSTTF